MVNNRNSIQNRHRNLRTESRLELLNTPWTLHFDREGTEDVAVIVDANGHDLAFSRHFWRPTGTDPIPATLAGIQLMLTAPKLLQSLLSVISQADGPIIGDGFRHPDVKAARRVISKALGKGQPL